MEHEGKKDKGIFFKCTAEYKLYVQLMAQSRGLSVAEFIRERIANNQTVVLKDDGLYQKLVDIDQQLSAIGNNINQIAKQQNTENGANFNKAEFNNNIDLIKNIQLELGTCYKKIRKLTEKALKKKEGK